MCSDGDRRGAGAGKPALQFIGEHQVRQLRLPVGRDPTVRALGLQIVEVDASPDALPQTADRHDPRTSGGGEHPVAQQTGQRKMTEVVGAELELESISRRALRRVHDPGVVDQQVDPVVAGP